MGGGTDTLSTASVVNTMEARAIAMTDMKQSTAAMAGQERDAARPEVRIVRAAESIAVVTTKSTEIADTEITTIGTTKSATIPGAIAEAEMQKRQADTIIGAETARIARKPAIDKRRN